MQWFIEQVIALVMPIANLGKEQNIRADAALSDLSKALTETGLYIRESREAGARRPEAEAHLAQLWASAVIPLRYFDRDLARICQDKSTYWIDPDNWVGDSDRELVISLEALRTQYNNILARE